MSLDTLVNQNSYGIAAAIVAVWVGTYALHRRTVRSLALLALVTIALAAPPLWLRSGRSDLVELDQALASGRPAMLEIYSDL